MLPLTSTISDLPHFSPHTKQRLKSVLIVATSLFVVASEAAAQIELQCLTGPNPLPAGCVSYEFEAELDNVIDPLGLLGALSVGNLVAGTITVNTDVQDLAIGSANQGFYPGAVECARIVFADRDVVVVQEPFVPDPTLEDDDPGLFIENDFQEPTSPIPLFIDTVAGGPAGAAVVDIFDLPPSGDLDLGIGAFAYNYTKGCLQGFQSPCPPTLLTNDSIPASLPADLMDLSSHDFSLTYAHLETPIGEARIRGEFTSLEFTTPVACPEPGLGLMLTVGVAGLGSSVRGRKAKLQSRPRS